MNNPDGWLKYILLIISVFILGSCIDSNIVIFETHNLPQNNWNCKDTVEFKTSINDLNNTYDCYIDIRNSGEYPYSNLYLFVTTHLPNGKSIRDTLESILANEQGKWLGNGLGDIKENRFVLKRGLRFPSKGQYTFKIIQAMRTNNLKGIYSFGMKIEKSFK